MNSNSWKLAETLIPPVYAKQAADAFRSRENAIEHFLQHRKLPENGWTDAAIEALLLQLSMMDSNNFPSNCGVGEREARVASALVAKRHYYFGHGIGRSGDLTETQPKAAGSSLMYKIANIMLADLLKIMGFQEKVYCLLLPVATGMSIVMSLLTLRKQRPEGRYIVWSRIDQKSCFKAILSAGFIPVVIDTVPSETGLVTDLAAMEAKIAEIGCQSIGCFISTTSCFAPRKSDEIEAVAVLCKKYDIPHLINNAYGLQSRYLIKRILKACRMGRVDVFVQSTDKNLMVPVGGAIVASVNRDALNNIASSYPGRASSSPLLDVFITMLSLGKAGYLKLVEDQTKMYDYLQQKLLAFADDMGEKVISSPENPISIAMTLSGLSKEKLTMLGSMLFLRSVSGARIVTTEERKTIENYDFQNWGCHCGSFSTPYMTAAASVGMTLMDVDTFLKKLETVYSKIKA